MINRQQIHRSKRKHFSDTVIRFGSLEFVTPKHSMVGWLGCVPTKTGTGWSMDRLRLRLSKAKEANIYASLILPSRKSNDQTLFNIVL